MAQNDEIERLRSHVEGLTYLASGQRVVILTLIQMLDRRGVVSTQDVIAALRATLSSTAAPANRPDTGFIEGIAAELDEWRRGAVRPDLQ